jgi:magnesium-transporting ATPase (P-type)
LWREGNNILFWQFLKMKFQFSLKYFFLFLFVLCVEIFIGVWVRDSFVRPFGGDFLVIFLMYYFLKTFIRAKSLYLIIAVVVFACLVELGQYFHLVDILGIKNKILRIMIGNSFSWADMLAYVLGGVGCYVSDKVNSLF